MKDDVREETEPEEEVENDLEWKFLRTMRTVQTTTSGIGSWDANQEKVKEAEKLLRDTDRCCSCDFDCPPPSEQENKNRLFGST